MGLLENQDQIKKDIEFALDVWLELFEKISDKIEYIYVKGSAIKNWESDIDYIPHISDLDVHIKVYDEDRLFPLDPASFNLAFDFTEQYEKKFIEKCGVSNHSFFHIPRIQMVQLNLHGGKGYNVPPRPQDVTILKGTINFKPEFPQKKVRDMDMRNVLVEREFIYSLPEKFFFQSSYEYFQILYKITPKVSPFPVRLLNQLLVRVNPHEVWTWNRTKIISELEKLGFTTLAEHYRQYYLTGWELYNSKFQDTDLFREFLKYGYSILFQVYGEVYNLQ